MKLNTMVKNVAVVVLGVVIAGFIISWGKDNDVPGFDRVHDGFDS